MRERLDQAVACRLRGVSDVGAQLSAGLDSSAVVATAARLLTGKGRVHAFTAVPRAGYDDGGQSGRLIDEGPLAAATAALYPNIEHHLVGGSNGSPLTGLDRNFMLHEQPVLNLCNQVWAIAINARAKAMGLKVLLVGDLQETSATAMPGFELLPELMLAGRWGRWQAEARGLVRHGHRGRGVLANTFGPWARAALWRLGRRFNGAPAPDPALYTAIRRDRAKRPDLERQRRATGRDAVNRPRRSGFEARLAALQAGTFRRPRRLAEWGLDVRDPTADRRLLEFCLGVPTDQFLRDGETRALAKRALADRLPPAVLNAPLRGLQAADWHEGLSADREGLAREVASLASCPAAANLLDLPRLQRMIDDWPQSGWHSPAVRDAYRLALLRGVSLGHFLRRVSGANA